MTSMQTTDIAKAIAELQEATKAANEAVMRANKVTGSLLFATTDAEETARSLRSSCIDVMVRASIRKHKDDLTEEMDVLVSQTVNNCEALMEAAMKRQLKRFRKEITKATNEGIAKVKITLQADGTEIVTNASTRLAAAMDSKIELANAVWSDYTKGLWMEEREVIEASAERAMRDVKAKCERVTVEHLNQFQKTTQALVNLEMNNLTIHSDKCKIELSRMIDPANATPPSSPRPKCPTANKKRRG